MILGRFIMLFSSYCNEMSVTVMSCMLHVYHGHSLIL